MRPLAFSGQDVMILFPLKMRGLLLNTSSMTVKTSLFNAVVNGKMLMIQNSTQITGQRIKKGKKGGGGGHEASSACVCIIGSLAICQMSEELEQCICMRFITSVCISC